MVLFTEGKVMAVRYDSKYTETSAVLNTGIDELLAGTLRQIRLKQQEMYQSKKKSRTMSRSQTGCVQVRKTFINSGNCMTILLFLST